MFYRTQKQTTPYALASALIACLSARPAAALLATPTLRLFTNTAFTVTPNTDPAAFVEATFDGYAAATIASFIGPVLQPPNNALVHQEADFLAGSMIGAGQVVTGYWLSNTDKTVWYCGEVFVNPNTGVPTPVNFANPGDFLSIDFALATSDVYSLNL